MPDDYRYPSADGRYGFLIEMWEAFNSHWVECPILMERPSGQTVLKFKSDYWSLDSAEWKSNAVVVMTLRKYPGDHLPASFELVFDCATLTATIGDEINLPVAAIEPALEKRYTAARRT